MNKLLRIPFFLLLFLLLFGFIFEGLCFVAFKVNHIIDGKRDYFLAYQNSGLYKGFDLEAYSAAKKKLHEQLLFDPYRHIKLPPHFKSDYFNTDEKGRRKTSIYLKREETLPVKEVAFFGGSTLFGIGAETDADTIPSYFAKEVNFEDLQRNYRVHNYGVGGYNQSQELIYLIEALKEDSFDVVIFYDFVNESLTSYREMRLNPSLKSQGFITPNQLSPPLLQYLKKTKVGLIDLEWIKETYSYRMYRVLSYRFSFLGEPEKAYSVDKMSQIDKALAVYERNMRVVAALSKEFDFRPLFIMQPTLFTKKTLSNTEVKIPHLQEVDYIAYEKALYDEARQRFSNRRDFLDLSRVFDQTSTTIYVDDHHMSSKGNEIIAKEIVRHFLKSNKN